MATGRGTSATDQPDGFGGRRPTSHEQVSGQQWDASYHDGPAPWEVGHPQATIVRLAEEGRFTGAVLDAGCGAGDNTLLIAEQASSVLGIDVAETALAMAREKAAERGIEAEFAAVDALDLQALGRRFDTVVDCGLFHALDTDERARYAASLASVTGPGARAYVLCFSDEGPETGPHPVRRDDLVAAFTTDTGWKIEAIEADRIETRFHDHGAPAWLASVVRTKG